MWFATQRLRHWSDMCYYSAVWLAWYSQCPVDDGLDLVHNVVLREQVIGVPAQWNIIIAVIWDWACSAHSELTWWQEVRGNRLWPDRTGRILCWEGARGPPSWCRKNSWKKNISKNGQILYLSITCDFLLKSEHFLQMSFLEHVVK